MCLRVSIAKLLVQTCEILYVCCRMNNSLSEIQADIQRLTSQQNQIQQQHLMSQHQKQMQQQLQQLQSLSQQHMQVRCSLKHIMLSRVAVARHALRLELISGTYVLCFGFYRVTECRR